MNTKSIGTVFLIGLFLLLIAFRAEGDEIGVFSGGTWELDWNGNGTWDGPSMDKAYSFGHDGDIPVSGDWNGDGKREIGFFREGLWYLDYNGNGVLDDCFIDRCYGFGLSTDIPVTGNWNGTKKTKIGVFRDGKWLLDWNGNGTWDGTVTDKQFKFGLANDIPVTGDWNGDGRTKAGVFREGIWLLDWNGNRKWDGTPTDKRFSFGLPGDMPVTGDWNYVGKTRVGIFREGAWLLDWNGNRKWDGLGKDREYFFGLPTDIPVTGNWARIARTMIIHGNGGSLSYDRSYSVEGVEAYMRDQNPRTFCYAGSLNGENSATASLAVRFPEWTGPAPKKVYACITHTTVVSPGHSTAELYVGGEKFVDLNTSINVTQKFLLPGTSVPKLLKVVTNTGFPGHAVEHTNYEMWLEVEYVGAEVRVQVPVIGTSGSFSYEESYSVYGVEANMRDQNNLTFCSAVGGENGENNKEAFFSVVFPDWTGPTPKRVYACITHSTLANPPESSVKFSSSFGLITNLSTVGKVTQKFLLPGTSVPKSLSVATNTGFPGQGVGHTNYEMWLEVEYALP